MTRALLVVPPLIKYISGPLLGPSLLHASASRAGHKCSTLDLNARYIRSRLPNRSSHRGVFRGDHDKPSDNRLSELEEAFYRESILPGSNATLQQALRGFLDHDQVEHMASTFTGSECGRWIRQLLISSAESSGTPQVMGVSLLHAGQVVPAAAISAISRHLWPGVLVVWGGPHISGLGANTLQRDVAQRKFAADVFVVGHAEQTFSDILHKVGSNGQGSLAGILQGYRAGTLIPHFSDLEYYDLPLTFPAQSTLGCSYGKCAYCTYPVVEPRPTKLPLDSSVSSVVEFAQQFQSASLSLKDSLVSPNRLKEIGDCISSRLSWSACTKLSKRLDSASLQNLSSQGLSTLEVGLESLLPEPQQRISKLQDRRLFEDMLKSTAGIPALSLVVNYMTGFPWEDPLEAESMRNEAEELLRKHVGHRGKLEHNTFELERLSPMARRLDQFGMNASNLRFWPWASIVEQRSS